jgi:hypothetical protein
MPARPMAGAGGPARGRALQLDAVTEAYERLLQDLVR